jgi:hypothetical protein
MRYSDAYACIDQGGWQMSGHRGKTTTVAEFKALWGDRSLTIADIGAILDISGDAVILRAKARGLPMRGSKWGGPRPKQIDMARFRAMWEAGVKRHEIAADIGLCKGSVYRIARRNGLLPKAFAECLTVAEFDALQVAA